MGQGYRKIVKSGEQLEIYTYSKELNVSRPKRHTRKNKRQAKSKTDSGASNAYRRIKSIQRARQGFLRLVKANLQSDIFPALATFTCYEQLTIEEAYEALRQFFTTLRGRYPDLRYISVPEWQKRGNIHFHALVWGIDPRAIFDEVPTYYRKKLKRKTFEYYSEFCDFHGFKLGNERGTRDLQRCWGRGYFDILSATNSSGALAGYLAKYLVKGLADRRLGNQRAYSSSHNVYRPISKGSNGLIDCTDEYLDYLEAGEKELQKISQYDTLWLGSCVYESFKITS
jgi:hypothetical protein